MQATVHWHKHSENSRIFDRVKRKKQLNMKHPTGKGHYAAMTSSCLCYSRDLVPVTTRCPKHRVTISLMKGIRSMVGQGLDG